MPPRVNNAVDMNGKYLCRRGRRSNKESLSNVRCRQDLDLYEILDPHFVNVSSSTLVRMSGTMSKREHHSPKLLPVVHRGRCGFQRGFVQVVGCSVLACESYHSHRCDVYLPCTSYDTSSLNEKSLLLSRRRNIRQMSL